MNRDTLTRFTLNIVKLSKSSVHSFYTMDKFHITVYLFTISKFIKLNRIQQFPLFPADSGKKNIKRAEHSVQ